MHQVHLVAPTCPGAGPDRLQFNMGMSMIEGGDVSHCLHVTVRCWSFLCHKWVSIGSTTYVNCSVLFGAFQS